MHLPGHPAGHLFWNNRRHNVEHIQVQNNQDERIR